MRQECPPGELQTRRRGWVVCLLSGAVLGLSLWLSSRGVEPFVTWSYHAAWYPLLFLADGALAAATGRFALLSRPLFAVSLFFWSAPAWFFFELLNLRVEAWFYVNVPPGRCVRWIGYFLAFATVFPAVFLPYRWLCRAGFAEGWRGPRVRVGEGGARWWLVSGVACLALPLWRPFPFHPLMWAAVVLLLAPWNHRRSPGDSLVGDLARGRYGRVARLLGAGLVAGVVWEGLNSLAGAYWIYTVPGLEAGKLFEMPVPGFLGFPPFAVECFVIYRWLVLMGTAVPGWDVGERGGGGTASAGATPARGAAAGRRSRIRLAGAALLALLFVGGVSLGVDRWTVDSYRASLTELPEVGAAESTALERSGLRDVRAVAASDSARVAAVTGLDAADAGVVVRTARLSKLRGLGVPAAARLVGAGIGSVCQVARAGAPRVSEILSSAPELGPRRGRGSRVRVRVREARKRCGSGRPGRNQSHGR